MTTPRTDAPLVQDLIDELQNLLAKTEAIQVIKINLETELSAKTAECQRLKEALERITESHARLEAERGSVVGTLTANARAALQDTP